MSKQSDLVENLKKFGLSEYESRAFLAIVRLGNASAPDLAKATNIPQAKIYGVLEDLSKRGFVYKDENSKPTKYFADKPIKKFKEFLKQFTDASIAVSNELEKSYEIAGGAHEYGFHSTGNFTEKLDVDEFLYIFAKDDNLFKKFFKGKKVLVDGVESSHNFYRVGGESEALVAFSRHRMIILIDKGDRVQFVSIEDPLFVSTIDQLMALSSVNRSLTSEMDKVQQLEGEKILYLDSIYHAEGTVFGEKGILWISNKRFFLQIPGKDLYAVPVFAIESCEIKPDGRLELKVKGRERAEEIIIFPESDSSMIYNLITFIQENGK